MRSAGTAKAKGRPAEGALRSSTGDPPGEKSREKGTTRLEGV